jgi:methylglutaconyl-CoA hydratase
MDAPFVHVYRDGAVAAVFLARPQARNAFNAELIAQLRVAFQGLDKEDEIRVITLQGEGKIFCGGADIAWMQASQSLTQEQNIEDARAMARMFRTIDRISKPVVARIHGAALGGGAGLAAVCDIVIASEDTIFGFTETKFGVLPAVISPFVAAKIGRSHLRALALTGERFDARRALHIGLVHHVASHTNLDTTVARAVAELLTASPTAIAAAKSLFAQVAYAPDEETVEVTARAIAAQRTTPEAQDGLRAFLEKRPAAWVR